MEKLEEIEQRIRPALKQLHADKTVQISEGGAPVAYLVDAETFRETIDRLAVLDAIAIGQKDMDEGRVLTHEQVKARMAKWLS
jgi:PHD/YefM family antitoxin component YafN of YafNO toxin-antitoxin module